MKLSGKLYGKLVTTVNAINTSGFVLKAKYDTNKLGLEKQVSDADKKIPNTGGLVKKSRLYRLLRYWDRRQNT